jgi:hypothetical protein
MHVCVNHANSTSASIALKLTENQRETGLHQQVYNCIIVPYVNPNYRVNNVRATQYTHVAIK